MPRLPPRLRNLLGILAAEPAPLPVREMADRLRVSRRTVFRELAQANRVLEGYTLEVGSRSGEGILLEGSPEAKTQLVRDLENMAGGNEPAAREERRRALLLAILRHPGRKLAAHADQLRVSAPTISLDLADLEPWLASHGLDLGRKPGAGISVSGDEMAVRRALLSLMGRDQPAGTAGEEYPSPDIASDLADLGPELDPLLGWMTPESRQALENYLVVTTQRLLDGNPLPEPGAAPGGTLAAPDPAAPPHLGLAEQLTRLLGDVFNLRPGPAETAALATRLAACRPVADPLDNPDPGLLALAGQMVDLFDPEQAHLLKMDNLLITGLANHLRTATVRLRHRVELADPLLGRMTEMYPEVMERCRLACQALAAHGDGWLPEDEVGLAAAHFGAALLRLADNSRQRLARVGIVCVHGIGSSYLLASRIKRTFGPRVRVEVSWSHDEEGWEHFDFLVSTVELPGAPLPVLVVPPIPGDADLQRVAEHLALLDRQAPPRPRSGAGAGDAALQALAESCRALEELAGNAKRLLQRFTVFPADPTADLAELARLTGQRFGDPPDGPARVGHDLLARERLGSQVVPELAILLLHCRTAGVSQPVLAVTLPGGGAESFSHPVLRGVRAGVILLLPEGAGRDAAGLLGRVSQALADNPGFLAHLHAGQPEAIAGDVEALVAEYLLNYTWQRLKG